MSGFVISIHAPPRGATGQIYAAISAAMAISIHAPPRGATVSSVPHYFFPVDFNSRPSARGDHRRHKYMQGAQKFQFTPLREGRLEEKSKGDVVGLISIHAPPRGATKAKPEPAQLNPDFNSRPSARGDGLDCLANAIENISIHAPPRGATLCSFSQNSSGKFQFTPLREGRRAGFPPAQSGCPISIHAPPRGATCPLVPAGDFALISIHAPPRGATP